MTVGEAINALNKKVPGRKIEKACEYKGNYLFIAPDSKLGPFNDFSDPIFIVNKNSGEVSKFVPIEDLDGFRDAILNHEIDV